MKKIFFLFLLVLISSISCGQELNGDELKGFNLFLMPAPQINISLSLDSNNIVDPTTGFSITPGAQTIDMMAVYQDMNSLQPKPYTPNSNTDFGRLRFKSDSKGVNLSINNNDRFAREFRTTNPAFFEANRNTALHRAYNPLSIHNNNW
jgi:hypothetical protein